jgi:hypothetical protein
MDCHHLLWVSFSFGIGAMSVGQGTFIFPQNFVNFHIPRSFADSTSQQQMTLEHQLSTSSSSPSASTGQPEYKHLSRLWEGYHQFVALRKAGYAMLHDLDLQQLTDDEMPRSHIDKCKSVCKIVVSYFC